MCKDGAVDAIEKLVSDSATSFLKSGNLGDVNFTQVSYNLNDKQRY